MLHISDMQTKLKSNSHIASQILNRIGAPSNAVWTPSDFADLGSRTSIDKALQRLAINDELRRIDRGLYDRPSYNSLTRTSNVPDYRAVIEAVARRDKARVLVDGMTAANDLGLTNAVPAKIEVLVDGRFKPIKLGNQEIIFKHAAPSRLYWADRPGMRVVQALHWLKDVLVVDEETRRVKSALARLFANGDKGREIRDDVKSHLGSLPIWMQDFLRPLLFQKGLS
jgi:hypothetical protein